MSEDIVIPYWNPLAELKPNSRILILGGSDSGKTTVILNLMYLFKHIPDWYAVNGTEAVDASLGDHIPPCVIHNQFDEQSFLQLVNEREKYIQELAVKYNAPRRRQSEWLYEQGYLKPLGIVIDDQGVNKALHDSELMNYYTTVSRHYYAFIIFAQHSARGLGTTARDQFDFVIACREPNAYVRRQLHEIYFGAIPSLRLFYNILDTCTADYEVLVINRRSRSNALTDMLRVWKADHTLSRTGFKCGSKKLWQYYYDVYNPIQTDNQSSFNKFTLGRKQNHQSRRIIKEIPAPPKTS